MNSLSISTDDTNYQHDFDFGSLSGMSSPVMSEFSDIVQVAPINDGRDELPSPSLDLLINSVTNLELPVDTLPALSSFIPIIEHLPGLVLENNSYHVKRPLLKAELQQLRSYTGRIRELTLTDTEPTNHANVAPETLSRLALIQDPKNPFLPSLESLHLVDADEALVYYLFFCITPSLACLEISQIPSTRQITIACFLEELVLNSPQLSNLTLGPGWLSESSLQSSLKFVHLRQLHIVDAADSLNFDFLRSVSLLPELESFIIDARTAEYKQRQLQPDVDPLAPARSSMGLPLSVEGRTPITTNIDDVIPFRRLRKLAVIANVALMGDLVYYLFPQEVKDVSLTLVQNGLPLQLPHWDKRRTDASTSDAMAIADDCGIPEPETIIMEDTVGNPIDNSPALELREPVEPLVVASAVTSTLEQPAETLAPAPSVSRCKKHKKRQSTSVCERCLKIEEDDRRKVEEAQERRLWEAQEQEHRDEEMQRLRATEEWLTAEREVREEEERKSNVISQTAFFAYVVEEILAIGNPDAFFIDRLEMASLLAFAPVTSSFEFPSPTFQMLLSYPTLKELRLHHWVLTCVDESLVNLAAVPSTLPRSMEKLQLPVDASLNSGITISTLHQIARYYPRLAYLECLVQQIPVVADSPLDLGTGFIPHGLEILSVGGGSPSIEDKINVSTYLSLLFPDLKAIEIHEGYDEDDWKYIHTLVKMCQKVRRDERLRH